MPAWPLAPGPIPARSGIQPVYEGANALAGAPLPVTRQDAREFWGEILCDVAKHCIQITEPTPNVYPSFRTKVPFTPSRAVVIPTGSVAADAIFESATVLATALGLATFVIGTAELASFTVPPGHAGILKGWEAWATGDPANSRFAIAVEGGSLIQAEVEILPGVFNGAHGGRPNTWGILKGGSTIKILARSTTTASPLLAHGSLDVEHFPVERPDSDSMAGLVTQAGRRNSPGIGQNFSG